jgi:hypothetical protein
VRCKGRVQVAAGGGPGAHHRPLVAAGAPGAACRCGCLERVVLPPLGAGQLGRRGGHRGVLEVVVRQGLLRCSRGRRGGGNEGWAPGGSAAKAASCRWGRRVKGRALEEMGWRAGGKGRRSRWRRRRAPVGLRAGSSDTRRPSRSSASAPACGSSVCSGLGALAEKSR